RRLRCGSHGDTSMNNPAPASRASVDPRIGTTMNRFGIVLLSLSACSSAHLDRNTGTVTLSRPTPATANAKAAPSDGPNATTSAPPREPPAAPNMTVTDARQTDPPNQPRADGLPTAPAKPKVPSCSNLPDPKPMRTDRWVNALVRLDHGKLGLAAWEPLRTRRAEVTPRKMGRFAAELWIGCELVDRVRFDFPLLGGEAPNHASHDPNFEAAGSFDLRIRLPDSERATRLELIDRAGERREILDWPLRQALPLAP
ncbi:MAG TPA: hypothetical protein VIV60_17870, partial [Polyangiaceae bacterium]